MGRVRMELPAAPIAAAPSPQRAPAASVPPIQETAAPLSAVHLAIGLVQRGRARAEDQSILFV